jgi:hypothetical protein
VQHSDDLPVQQPTTIDHAPIPRTVRLDAKPRSHRVRWLGLGAVLGLAATLFALQALLDHSTLIYRERIHRHVVRHLSFPSPRHRHQLVRRVRIQVLPARPPRHRYHIGLSHSVTHRRIGETSDYSTSPVGNGVSGEPMSVSQDASSRSHPPPYESKTSGNSSFSYLGR